MLTRSSSRLVPVALFAAAFGFPGCDLFIVPPDPNPGGNGFDTARAVVYDAGGQADLSGSITGDEVQVYDLGALVPGDRLIISVGPGSGSALDPIVAVFNANAELYSINDDVDFSAGKFESFLDSLIRAASDRYYLVIARSPFTSGNGSYIGAVTLTHNVNVPTLPTQVLLLNFGGGANIVIPNVGDYDLPPFDAADIDPVYDGKTAEIRNRIIETVESNYADFGIVILTDEDTIPPGCQVTTIHFGSFSRTVFGIAEDVDIANVNKCDDGIVYTDNFDDPFAGQPSTTGIAVAIGNVAAHEAGHLLGLNHVADVTDLMDSTGTASTLLADQNFKTAPLESAIFPIGSQNGPWLLNLVIPKN